MRVRCVSETIQSNLLLSSAYFSPLSLFVSLPQKRFFLVPRGTATGKDCFGPDRFTCWSTGSSARCGLQTTGPRNGGHVVPMTSARRCTVHGPCGDCLSKILFVWKEEEFNDLSPRHCLLGRPAMVSPLWTFGYSTCKKGNNSHCNQRLWILAPAKAISFSPTLFFVINTRRRILCKAASDFIEQVQQKAKWPYSLPFLRSFISPNKLGLFATSFFTSLERVAALTWGRYSSTHPFSIFIGAVFFSPSCLQKTL